MNNQYQDPGQQQMMMQDVNNQNMYGQVNMGQQSVIQSSPSMIMQTPQQNIMLGQSPSMIMQATPQMAMMPIQSPSIIMQATPQVAMMPVQSPSMIMQMAPPQQMTFY